MAPRKMDYEVVKKEFKWEDVNKELDGESPRLNMAHEVCDRHAENRGKIAFFWEGKDGKSEKYSFWELKNLSNKFANVLDTLGVKKGDRVCSLLPRIPEVYITFLGVWKTGAVYVPLFTALGPEAISYRVQDSGPKVLVTDSENRDKIGKVEKLVEHIVVFNSGEKIATGDLSFWGEMGKASRYYNTVETEENDLSTISYTSGTTGLPKGAMIHHGGIKWLVPYTKYCYVLQESDLFFTTADPAWTYGLFTTGISIWLRGLPNLIYEGLFRCEDWYRIMEKYQVTKIGAVPTAYRMMMREGDLLKNYDLNIKAMFSAGEPIEPKVIHWLEKNFKAPVVDCYGLTEAGMEVNNYLGLDMKIKPGSIGKPLPGKEIAIIDENGNELPPNEVGIIGIKLGPGMFTMGYWNKQDAWRENFIGDWFDTKDSAYKDEDGYFWFVGRTDDVIKSAGYRIGPAEVEKSMLEHPAVAEAAAIAKPEPIKGSTVKGVVVLKKEFKPSPNIAEEIKAHVKKKLSKHAYPREIEFVDELPKTETGKIKRAELRRKEML